MDFPISFSPTPKSDLFLTQKRDPRLIASGFPAASDDYADKKLNLHEHLVKNPSATYFMEVASTEFSHLYIFKNDLLIIDRSITPRKNSLIVYSNCDSLVLDRLVIKQELLLPSGISSPGENLDWTLWGVVTFVVHPTGTCSAV